MNILQGVFQVNNVHPMFVHFPVALLVGALAFTVLGILFKMTDLEAAGKWTLYFGTFGAMAAVLTGLIAFRSVPHVEGAHQIMVWHQYFGYVILGVALLLSLWRMKIRDFLNYRFKWIFVASMVVMAGMIAVSSDWGAQMVYLHGVGVKASSAEPSPSPKVFRLDELQRNLGPTSPPEHSH